MFERNYSIHTPTCVVQPQGDFRDREIEALPERLVSRLLNGSFELNQVFLGF